MSREKTEVMWVEHQREDLNISLDGKEINQVDGFVYLRGMVNEDGHSEVEMRCRIQQGAVYRRKRNGLDKCVSNVGTMHFFDNSELNLD